MSGNRERINIIELFPQINDRFVHKRRVDGVTKLIRRGFDDEYILNILRDVFEDFSEDTSRQQLTHIRDMLRN